MTGLDALQAVQFVTKKGKRLAVRSADFTEWGNKIGIIGARVATDRPGEEKL